MTAPYLPPCPLGCDAEGHVPSCARFSAAHDAPGTWPPVASDSPFAPGADDDPEMPGRCRDAADVECPLCFPFKVACDCERGPFDFGEPVSDGCGVDDGEDLRPSDRPDF